MNTVRILSAYAVAFVAFGALDACWLTAMQKPLYRPALGSLLADKPDLAAAAAFYLIYIGGLAWFAVLPGLRASAWTAACLNGAVLGFVAYGAYDLTNQATLRSWSWKVTVLDMAWGAFASALAAAASYGVTAWIERAKG